MAVNADVAAAGDDVPLLVRVLAGNSVTSATILACLNTADARHLRRLHPAVAGAVAAVPWCDTDTPVVDVVRWRAALPGAVGARLEEEWKLLTRLLPMEPIWAALGGLTYLDLRKCDKVTDKLILRLPSSLAALYVGSCQNLSAAASFAHLTELAVLDCSGTWVMCGRTHGLPPSLQELNISKVRGLLPGSLTHLRQLRVLRANGSELSTSTLASLPPSVEELHMADCWDLRPAASFSHLIALRLLDGAASGIDDSSLATMPPSLVSLNARGCVNLTPAATVPPLPALQMLDVSNTAIGDALVAALPASLIELRLTSCRSVTAGASLDHLRALRMLHCIGTELAPATLAACHARGCAVPAARQLHGHGRFVVTLVVLGDGRLASGDIRGEVRLWDVAAGREATAVPTADEGVRALAALPDGRRLAIGTASWAGNHGCIEVWDVVSAPPVRRTSIDCDSSIVSLAVLADGRLTAGCGDGGVQVVDVDAGAVAATLAGHTGRVTALAVLADGTLASGSWDASVRLWDVRAQACVATLTGHNCAVACLAVLSDGRLVSETTDGAVRLWDVGARACVAVLPRHTGRVTATTALPDGRLVTGSDDGTVRMWDTRPAAAAGASRAAAAAPVEVVGVLGGGVGALLPLPDGRFVCTGPSETGPVHVLELPPPATYD